MKIYCRCLRPDIEYKTLVINYQTSCKELIMMLLNKAKMKHRDPKLFYLTMEVGVRKSGTISNTQKNLIINVNRKSCGGKREKKNSCLVVSSPITSKSLETEFQFNREL